MVSLLTIMFDLTFLKLYILDSLADYIHEVVFLIQAFPKCGTPCTGSIDTKVDAH